MRFTTALCYLLFFSLNGSAQSIHEEQLEQYNATGHTDAAYYEAQPSVTSPPFAAKQNCTLEKVVYGWHPYWVGSAYTNYQWDLLSHFSFFSYEVNPNDGTANDTHGWSTSAAVDAALASGNTKVTLCVTLFSGHSTFFSSSTSQQTLITNLINMVQSRGAHGVNIDFEGLPSSQATNFANFMVNLSNQMHAAIPGSEVSTVLYAVDWSNVFDFSIMEPEVDHYIIMGYGYYYSGSSNAGPTDPLYHFGSSYNYTLSRTITYYLDDGVPADKLILGLPSYGYEWATSSTSIPSSTTGSGTARTYAYVQNNSVGEYSVANHTWEANSFSDNFTYDNGGTQQCFISQDSAWQKRLEHVRNTGIGGIGIWALGYDNGYNELWNVMNDYLTDCYEQPCSGTIHDFGGPTRNYYDNEDYTWTVAPPNATSLDIDFTMFDVEANFDYLYVFDGPDDQSPQLAGSPFTGTTGPGQFTTSTGAVTFRFTSDGATVTPGFLANYTCNTVPAPVAGFAASATEICSGDSIQLINTSSDAETLLWSTSSGGLSSTSNDTTYLFPGSSGNYTITLTVSNVSGTDQTSNSLNVSVLLPPVSIPSASATYVVLPNADVNFSNSSQNATDYYWNFGDGNTSTNSSPSHTYTSEGIYSGYLVASNNACTSDTAYFEITVGNSVGLSSQELEDISIYPNPFQDEITIRSESTIQTVVLHDLSGQEIPVLMTPVNGGYSLQVNVASGAYFLSVTTENSIQTWDLIKM